MTQRASIASLLRVFDQESSAGFAIALHVGFTAPRYLFQTYPKRWMQHYSANGLMMHDPTVHWGLQNTGHIRWADLRQIDRAGVLDQARDHGILNGITVAVVDSGSRSIASFARGDRDYSDEEMMEIEENLRLLHCATLAPGAINSDDMRALTELSIRLTHG